MEFKRFHLLGLAHLPTTSGEQACAFTQKVIKLAPILKPLGQVFFYGNEDSEIECTEFIPVLDKQIRESVYGVGTSWNQQVFNFKEDDLAYRTFNNNAIREINKRKQPGDFLLLPFGNYEKVIANNVDIPLTVESGIGYGGTFAKYRVFESYAWMHYIYGCERRGDGSFCDAVIPNYFNPDDFDYTPISQKEDYFLYLGRIIHRKGIVVAKQAAEAAGVKLILAGPLGCENVDIKSPNLEYVGYADRAKRRELLSKARALFVPTQYIGPFEGVSIEAAFSGCPVITTDWGAFGENVLHGITGYRCRTLEQFVWAVKNIDKIQPIQCYNWALNNFTISRIGNMYKEYFEMLARGDWKQKNPERTELDWLSKYYD